MKAKLQPRAEGCLSDLVIDMLVAAEITPEKEKDARAHLAGCEACKARHAAQVKARAAFAAEPLPSFVKAPAKVVSINPRSRWKTLGMVGSGLALAAAVLLYVRTRPVNEEDDMTTRLKGGSHIGFYKKRGDTVTLGQANEHVRAGDALRFVYTTGAGRTYLTILSLDGAKHASVYYADGPNAAHVDAAVDRAIDASTVLDGTLGDETLYGVFCSTSVATEPMRVALETTGKPTTLDGCQVDSVMIHKEAAPTP